MLGAGTSSSGVCWGALPRAEQATWRTLLWPFAGTAAGRKAAALRQGSRRAPQARMVQTDVIVGDSQGLWSRFGAISWSQLSGSAKGLYIVCAERPRRRHLATGSGGLPGETKILRPAYQHCISSSADLQSLHCRVRSQQGTQHGFSLNGGCRGARASAAVQSCAGEVGGQGTGDTTAFCFLVGFE